MYGWVFAFWYVVALVVSSLLLHAFHLEALVGTQWSIALSGYLMVMFVGGLQGSGRTLPMSAGRTSKLSNWWKGCGLAAVLLSAGWRFFGGESPLPPVLEWTLMFLWAFAIYSAATACANRWHTKRTSAQD